MTAAARAVPNDLALKKLMRDNRQALGDLSQGEPVMYGDLIDAIGAAKLALTDVQKS